LTLLLLEHQSSDSTLNRKEPVVNAHLRGVVENYVKAVNAQDTDGIVALFAPDAYVNDARREIRGVEAIRRWVEKEIVGDHITMDVREVVEHYDETIVSSRYDGDFDKSSLPEEVVLTDYFHVLDGQIVSLVVVRNQPSPY
jgi:SnoaL-like domain